MPAWPAAAACPVPFATAVLGRATLHLEVPSCRMGFGVVTEFSHTRVCPEVRGDHAMVPPHVLCQ